MTKEQKKVDIKPSSKLIALINLYNLVEQGSELLDSGLPDAEEILSKIPELLPAEKSSNNELVDSSSLSVFFGKYTEAVRQIKRETRKYPNLLDDISKLICAIKEIEYFHDEGIFAWNDYKEFIDIRCMLYQIAIIQDRLTGGASDKHVLEALFGNWEFNSKLIVNENGIVEFEKPTIILALEGAIFVRIKICHVCKRLFWSYRIDAFGCSEKCNNNIRAWRRREKKGFFSRSRVIHSDQSID